MTRIPDELANKIEAALWFDPHFLCIFCDLPVQELSNGGPMACPWCDNSCHRDGREWTVKDATGFNENAKRRCAEILAAMKRKRLAS